MQTGRDEAKEIRAFGLSDALRERFDGIYRRYLADLRRHVGRRSRLALIGNLGAAVFLGLALVAVILLIDRGRIGLAGAAIVAIRLLSSQVSTVFKSAQQIFESGLFLDDLDDFVAMRPAAEQAEDGAPGPSRFDEITVEGLDFTYPDSDTLALRDVSLRIRSGEIIALVGENGSGKTTLAKLLATLYDPDAGRIAWDGVDVSNYRRADLRRSIAVIFQDLVHYHMTARDNIGLGRRPPGRHGRDRRSPRPSFQKTASPDAAPGKEAGRCPPQTLNLANLQQKRMRTPGSPDRPVS